MIFPPTLAKTWVEAWNRRDLDALLEMYAAKIELRSPFARVFAKDGVIRDREELRTYWSEAMRRLPNLKMELVAVYAGHKAMTLHYCDETGRNCMETMLFDDHDKVIFEVACLDRAR